MTKKTIFSLTLVVGLVFFAAYTRQGGAGAGTTPKLETEDQKTMYAMGFILGGSAKVFKLTPEELAFVKAGFVDAATEAKPQVEINLYGTKLNDLARQRAGRAAHGAADPEEAKKIEEAKKMADEAKKIAEEAKKKGKDFAETAAKQPGAIKTPSGIVIRTITAGSGASPAASDTVKVHYEGKLIDGFVFDSSIARKEPAEFQLNKVVPCWTEAVQKMKKGEKSQIVCPSDMAYGDAGDRGIPPGATLSFEVELLDFHK